MPVLTALRSLNIPCGRIQKWRVKLQEFVCKSL